MKNQNFYYGQLKIIAKEKISHQLNQEKMIGYKLLALFQAEMIHNVNINIIKIKNQQFKKVIGLREKMKN